MTDTNMNGKRQAQSSESSAGDSAKQPRVDQLLSSATAGEGSPMKQDTPPTITSDAAEDDDDGSLSPAQLGATLAELYRRNQLDSSSQQAATYEANENVNNKVMLWRGDITKLRVDCIVNAANKSLLGGGGVDGAIHAAAGPSLLAECRTLKGAKTGQVKLTAGHDLPAKMVAHAVGPIYSKYDHDEAEALLRSCYRTTLELCMHEGLRSVAFSGISTGVYGYPLDDATKAAADEVRKFLDSEDGAKIDHVIFTVFRQIDVDTYSSNLPLYFPPSSTTLARPSSAQQASDRAASPPSNDDPSSSQVQTATNAAPSATTVQQAHTNPTSATTQDESTGQTVAVPAALAGVKGSLARDEIGMEETTRGEVTRGQDVSRAKRDRGDPVTPAPLEGQAENEDKQLK